MAVGPTARHRRILERLHTDGFVEVDELALRFDVSHMTIRRDLAGLEEHGYLVRTHGGAVKSRGVDAIFGFEQRIHRNREQKERLCEIAARYVEPGEILLIDCGTTLYRLGRFIGRIPDIRVVTNSLPLVSELGGVTAPRLTLTGGDLVPERKATYGRLAEGAIRSIHADKAFIGADGVSLQGGLTSYDEQEGRISLSMAEAADWVFLLCDSSKLGYTSYYRFAPLSIIDTLVTDAAPTGAMAEVFEREHIKVIHG